MAPIGYYCTIMSIRYSNLISFSKQEIDGHKDTLEAQLACWEQIQAGKDEVQSWLASTVNKLDDSLNHFDDAVTVDSCLMKYKVTVLLHFYIVMMILIG